MLKVNSEESEMHRFEITFDEDAGTIAVGVVELLCHYALKLLFHH